MAKIVHSLDELCAASIKSKFLLKCFSLTFLSILSHVVNVISGIIDIIPIFYWSRKQDVR